MASEVEGRTNLSEVEQTIRRLRDVVSARIVADTLGHLQEVHVLVESTRNPKLISRDIESALMSELGIRIDHRKISIAQIRSDATLAYAADRLKLLNLAFTVDRKRAEARVTLGRNEDVYTGAASAPARDYDRLRLAAAAAADAVSGYISAVIHTDGDEEPKVVVQGVLRTEPVGPTPAVLALVRLSGGGHEQDLLGSALVGEDESWAAACATLDAVNRRLSSVMEG
jgi:hypothetical protein